MGATGGVVHLVYVHANDGPCPTEPLDPDPTYTAGLASFFEAVERELAPPPGISFVRARIQRGDPAPELLAYAVANGMELIAVGNHGNAMRERLHLGSVSAGILRSAQCPVLVSGTSRGSAPPGTQAMEAILRGER
jgi:nucleotide-binding universal stress UspA family protein